MKYLSTFACFIVPTFFMIPISMAESATATQTISISVPEVNLLDIPETIAINLTLGEDGYYSGRGEFSYSITTNSASATEKKRIMASIIEPNFGDEGSLMLTMTEPSGGATQTTVFQSGETEGKTLVGNISNVAEKDIALSVVLNKLSLAVVKPYINAETLQVAYPVGIRYTLAY